MSQENFFNKEKVNFKKIVINNANFSLLRNDLKLLNELRGKKLPNKKIKINNSNIFFKDNFGEIVSIIKVNKTVLFFDDKKLLNFFNLKGQLFNMPFLLDIQKHIDPNKYEQINFSVKPLELSIINKFIMGKNELINGENTFSILNSRVNTKYNIKEKLITFRSDNSRLDSAQINYNGKLSINPFDLDLDIKLKNYKVSKLLNKNPIMIELIRSGLLYNDNISINTSIVINSDVKNEIFQKVKINFQIINGKINFNKTMFVNDDIGSLNLSNSDIFFKDNKLLFNTDISIDIKSSEKLYSLLNIKKSLRKNLKIILVNLDYNFLSNQIKFNNVRIDKKDVSSKFLKLINDFDENIDSNFNKNRRLISELLKAYEG